ncbi:hypothetical protein ACGF07_18230 [Kitasatospora sp. NPDC048194]|uniref:hypothetical protein n=1 Tax=Kitasatospora sp. NPDC048194 TaxID=3364045 RepID=UPI0037239F02
MPLRPARPRAVLVGLLLFAAGCTTVGGPGDRAAAGRELSAAELRAAAVVGTDLGPGYTVTLIAPGRGGAGAAAGRETADVAACQPLLDAVGPAVSTGAEPGQVGAPGQAGAGAGAGAPGAGTAASPSPGAGAVASPSPGSGHPYAETELSVARSADPKAEVHGGLLGYPAGGAAALQAELEQLFGRCAAFTSAVPAPPAERAGKRVPVRTRHRLNREDTPTPEGADSAIGFTLTNESGTAVPARRAVLVRVGPALAVFTTLGVAAEPAGPPDERVVRRQVAKLRAAQAGPE